MIALADLIEGNETERTVAISAYTNSVGREGFAAWRNICAETIRFHQSFDTSSLLDFIDNRSTAHDFDDTGMLIVKAAVEIAAICSEQHNLAASDDVDWDGICEKVQTGLPQNMKVNILTEILATYREDMKRPNREEMEGQCWAAIIDRDDNNRGDLIKIRMSIMNNGSGLFYPDPYAAFLKINDERFSTSLDNVARACGLIRWNPGRNGNDEPSVERNFDVRWSFFALNGEHFFDPNGIRGPSLGGAMYTLCRALMMDAGKSLPPGAEGAEIAGGV